ncbi:hypothetical protein N7468_001093 [Penicillium chermesinum]|uniref:Importin N-terminal domain-containing protein n=1 Tax=Penicillium chermesinum TaxID=63820 RepID=A0A9W9PG44_9EURO|nr:uncharacterized protein N7468_001093 [Penicillium chermesinum]KAJ5246110.1 hypothetical protein N7468_001093 [Penicillium chermesinum]
MVMIEVAGEASPLSYQNVVNTLAMAASSNQQQVKVGTQQLQNWQKQPTYHSLLQDAFADYSLPTEVRYLAIIQLKNGVGQYWRKTAPNAIAKEEKDKIKTLAMQSGIAEPVPALALQNSLMIAKILRFEFPNDWPDAISALITSLRSSIQPGANLLQLPRTLLILLQTIKELSTARIQRTRHHLQAVSPEIFHVLGGVYVDKVNNWTSALEQGGADEKSLLEEIEQSLVSLKVIRRLIIAGFEHPGRVPEVQEFWTLTYSHFVKFLSFVNDGKLPEQIQRAVERHIYQLSKFHVEMAKTHPASFAHFAHSIDLVNTYWTLLQKLSEVYVSLGADAETEGQSLPERTGLRALLLIRACARMAFNPVQTFKYQTAEDKEERKQAVERIKTELFTDKFVLETMELLVTQFFRFRNIDFEEWEAEPEQWEKKEEVSAEAWEFSIRSCSEKLFLDLIIHFKGLLIDRLLDVFHSFARTDNRNVILKDSLYSAIGLAAASLEQRLDFNAFLQNTMVAEVQVQDPEYRLLRRRIAMVLGQWVPVQPDRLNTDAIYQIFQHLLNKDDPLNDLVVRITAGRQLCNVINPYEFSPAAFMPYAPSILGNLMSLVQETDISETKMGLLETVRVVVVKMEHNESARYHSLILPLIQGSVNPESETFVYLLDEALDLWAAIIMQTPTPASPEIISLFPAILPILDQGTDSTPQALTIIESYIYLAPQEQRTGVVARLVELMIRGAETVDGGSEAIYRVISQSLVETGFLQSLLEGLYSAYEASQTTGPNRKVSNVVGVVETDYFSVLARLALANPSIFISAVSAATKSSEEQTMAWLLTELVLAPPPTFILNHLQSYLNIWTDIVVELAEGGSDPNADYLVYWSAPSGSETANPENSEEVETPENLRRREWESADAIHRFPIRSFVRQRMEQVVASCGGAERFKEEWLANVDADVLSTFLALGVL